MCIQDDAETDQSGGVVDKPPSWFQPQNHKTRLLQFHGAKYSAALNADLKVQVSSINAENDFSFIEHMTLSDI